MDNKSYLTNEELTAQLSLRNDLTALEQQLLDRLILANEECSRLEKEVTSRLAQPSAGDGPILP